MTVVLDNVTRIVGAVPYISDVSLTLEPGTLSVLLGPTLSGKTSLMRLLAGGLGAVGEADTHDRRHRQTHVADAVQPLLERADRQHAAAVLGQGRESPDGCR